MDDAIDLDRLQRREDSLTVIQGCLATVLAHWDRLSGVERHELLQLALTKTERLVDIYTEEVENLRLGAERPVA